MSRDALLVILLIAAIADALLLALAILVLVRLDRRRQRIASDPRERR